MSKSHSKNKSSGKPDRKAPAKAGSAPSIVSPFATQEAAAMLSRKTGSGAAHKESSIFKQMKEGLSEPHLDGLGKMLDQTSSATGKKSAQPFNHNRGQTGHNQTYGADVNRTGVPRRTAG